VTEHNNQKTLSFESLEPSPVVEASRPAEAAKACGRRTCVLAATALWVTLNVLYSLVVGRCKLIEPDLKPPGLLSA